jgi:hypothetical protein
MNGIEAENGCPGEPERISSGSAVHRFSVSFRIIEEFEVKGRGDA